MKEYDIFMGKSLDEVQLQQAIDIVEEHGYKVIKTDEDAKRAAIEAGFRVLEPLFVDDKILSLKDLRNLFYSRLYRAYPNETKFQFETNFAIDLKFLRLLVESREKTGLNRFNAIQEAAAIINIIFDNLSEFNFDRVPDIRILGQGKMAWVTNKAIELLNRRLLENELKHVENRINKIEEDVESNLNSTKERDKLKKLLANLEE